MAGNLKDFATGIVVTAPSPATSGTSLILQTGEGARMPAVPFDATAHPAMEMPTLDNAEKIQVTDVTDDTLTIVREQGDTTAQSIEAGWRVSNALFASNIPTALSELTDDTTHRVVTDTEKTTWDDKSDFSGVYADLTSKPDLTNLPNQSVNSTDTPTFGDVVITGLSGSIITDDNVETAIEDLDDSVAAMAQSGFGAWTSGTDASTYTITGNKFQIDRTGYGYINSKKITWASGLQTATLTANACHWIYIDTDATLKASTTFPGNKIILYQVLYDGTNYDVTKENHPYSFNRGASGYFHNNINTTIRGTGAVITRVTTGTGASTNDREVKIVGADTLDDHGLSTTIPDSGGAAVAWNVYYRNGSGKWVRHAQQSMLPIYYNNAGTPTALDVVNAYAEYVLYVCKDDIENSNPIYYAVMGETSYTTLGGVLAAITDGSSIYATNELRSIELAQLGYAVVQYSGNGGYINQLNVAKQTFNQSFVGGGASAGNNHSLLDNLDADDHVQYHTDSRGDARYTAKNGAITGATKTKITYDAKGLVTSGTDATTADIADSSDKRYCTDAQKTVIGNTSGTNTGDNATNSQYSGLAASKENTGVAASAVTTHAALTTGVHGAGANSLIYSNDSRLTDARTPVAHNQAESTVTFTDISTGNVSTSNHGYFPKLPTATGKFLKDDMTWEEIAGGGDMLGSNNLSDVADAPTARNNILPSKTGNSLKVLRVNSGETDYEVATISGDTGSTMNYGLTNALAAGIIIF